MSLEDYEPIAKLDGMLNLTLAEPHIPNKLIGYDPAQRKVRVYIHSSALKIPGFGYIGSGIHVGKVGLNKLPRLAKREDIIKIRAREAAEFTG